MHELQKLHQQKMKQIHYEVLFMIKQALKSYAQEYKYHCSCHSSSTRNEIQNTQVF